jgi:hypothetical protein
MTRVFDPPRPENFDDPGERAAFERFVALRARQYDADPATFRLSGYYAALGHSPFYAHAQLRSAFALRSVGNREGSYSHSDREWVDQVLSHTLDTYKVLAEHTRDAISVGVRLEAIEALWQDREEDLTERERLLASFIRKVATGTMDDDTWAAVGDDLGVRGRLEYTAFIGHLIVVLRMFQALDVPAQITSREDLLALLAEIRDGSVEIPNVTAAVRVGSQR